MSPLRRFAFRLAVRVGVVNVDRDILRALTYKQICEWGEYAELEPFDEIRMDYRFASICALIANVHRGKNQKAFKLEDFVLRYDAEAVDPQREEQARSEHAAEQMRIINMFAEAQIIANATMEANRKRAEEEEQRLAAMSMEERLKEVQSQAAQQ